MSRRFGIISDTHGALHDDVPVIFAGVKAILHGGDVMGESILRQLGAIAPVHAIAGNCDIPGEALPARRVVELPFGRAGMAHGHLHSSSKAARHRELLREFEADEVRLIVTGHSHQPHLEFSNDVYILNPGAAARPRFNLQSSVCVIEWDKAADLLKFEFVPLRW